MLNCMKLSTAHSYENLKNLQKEESKLMERFLSRLSNKQLQSMKSLYSTACNSGTCDRF